MRYSDKIFCEALADLLNEKKVKLRSLAVKTNLDFSYFSKLTKRRNSPPIDTLVNISQALEVPPDFFIEYRIWLLSNLLINNPLIINDVVEYAEKSSKKTDLKVAEEEQIF